MKYGCKSKQDVLLQLNYMVIHAPDFPPEGGMTTEMAFATVEYGLARIAEIDGTPSVLEGIGRIRSILEQAKLKFAQGEIVPACHLLQDAEDVLRPLRVKAGVS